MGALACHIAGAALLTGCGASSIEIDGADLSGADATACTRLIQALPDAVQDQSRRSVEPDQAYGAAWGDPGIVLRCGVPRPDEFDKFATCQVANDVAWFVPESQIEDQGADVVMTTVGFAQNVEVYVPADYRPPAAVMVDLADAIKRSLREVKPCL